MVLKDIINDYQFIDSKLSECEDYFTKCQAIIDTYFEATSAATAKFFSTVSNDSTRSTFVNDMSTAMSKCFSLITKLNSSAYIFYSCVGVLKSKEYTIDVLAKEISDFEAAAQTAITSANTIIEAQLDGMKKRNLLPPFIKSLQNLFHIYHSLKGRCALLFTVEQQLMEPLPTEITGNVNYEEFNIQSLAPTKDMLHISDSLAELSHFFEIISRLNDSTDSSDKAYYLRKVETGSLLTAFVTTILIVRNTVKLIDYCYPKFLQWQQAYYTTKEQQLKLSMQELETAKKLLEIGPDIENADELLQAASARLFKYFKLNPEFKVNDKEYKTNINILLLQQNETSE